MSLFSSAGIGDYFLNRNNIDIVVANELVPRRALLYRQVHKNTQVVIGDITNEEIFDEVEQIAKEKNVKFMIASPPCQGMSVAGKNRKLDEMTADSRNYLLTYVVKMIKSVKPDYIIIENVPSLFKLKLKIDSTYLSIEDYLKFELGNHYNIETDTLDTANYDTPQRRKRAIVKINKHDTQWSWPRKSNEVKTVIDAIGDLPTLESGEYSKIKWHFGRTHDERQIEWMRHTPTGKSAFENLIHYPRKRDGTRVKGYQSSYRRIKWNEPAPTITIRNDCISSQRNVHPGRLKKDGTYSDARVLSILELMRLTGLPDNWEIPVDTPEILIRQVLGECIPPLLIEALVKEIEYG